MDFILGANNTEKTTCLIHMANEYIIDNKINANKGYILLFTPPLSDTESTDSINQNKKNYNFYQYFTNYKPQYKENMNLIKCYTLNNFTRAYGLIDNFRLISYKNNGLKLILIDDITTIIHSWVNDAINKQLLKSKPEEKENIKNMNNILLLYNEIFQQFLSKIISLQKCYQAKCFISLDINISEHLYFSKNSPRIFNAIFPYIRSAFYLNKINDNIIVYNELKLYLNSKTNKIVYEIVDNEESDENQNQNWDVNKNENNDDKFLKEKIEKLEKKSKQRKNFTKDGKYMNWMKKVLNDFVENMNNFNELRKQLEEKKKLNQEEEDSSYTQMEK